MSLSIPQLLSKPKFSGVEKIKTIGSTYMAAAGLSGTPGQENNQVQRPRPPGTQRRAPPDLRNDRLGLFYQDKEKQQAQIGILVEFAIAMIGKLDGINRHSFNSFRLRVGENAIPSLNYLTAPAPTRFLSDGG